MTVQWSFPAETFLDQLSGEDERRVLHALSRLPLAWNEFVRDGALKPVAGEDPGSYVLRVGSDLRVVLRRDSGVITVDDVIRRGQLVALGQLAQPR